MKIATEIIRHPFGVTSTGVAADWYGADIFSEAKSKALEQHKSTVGLFTEDNPQFLGLTAGYDEQRDEDGGIRAEWWTVVVLDRGR